MTSQTLTVTAPASEPKCSATNNKDKSRVGGKESLGLHNDIPTPSIRNNEDWKTVTATKRRQESDRRRTIIKRSGATDDELKTVELTRRIHICFLVPETTAESVTVYMNKKNPCDAYHVEKLKLAHVFYSSFSVTLPSSKYEFFMSAENWPQRTQVSEWFRRSGGRAGAAPAATPRPAPLHPPTAASPPAATPALPFRSNHLRQDGGLCFEIPPWQHRPVELDQHLEVLRHRFSNHSRRHQQPQQIDLANSEITRYMNTVLAPFLDTYHRNIQNSYQLLTGKILRRIKEEINNSVMRKNEIYTELTELADKLNVPEMCQEERRLARTLANKHVANIYACTEEARSSIAKMGNYAEEMISITRNHMQSTLEDVAKIYAGKNQRSMQNSDIESCIQDLSRAAVSLGYELDLSLTNARRHNEQSCEYLTSCSSRAGRNTDDAVEELREQIYQCVYA